MPQDHPTSESTVAHLRAWLAQPPTLGGLRDGAVVLAVVRTLVLLFLFPYVAWLDAPHKPWIFLILGVALVAHVAFVTVYVRGTRTITPTVAQATILVDTIAIVFGVLATGGATSAAAMIWAPNLAIGSVWLGVRAMIPAVAVVTVELTVLGFVGHGQDGEVFTTAQTAVMAAFMLAMLVVVGGVVAQRQRATMRALDSAEARARRDPLTGLLNRTAAEERLHQELARGRRAGTPLGVLVLDLDDFKMLNDTRGHLVGDMALMSVANILLTDKRTSDAAARMGGEEFLLLLPDTGEAEVVAIANRIRERIAASSRSGITITASIGVACAPAHANTAFELLVAADSALYAAKRAGKNRIALADDSVMRPAGGGPGDAGYAAALARRAATIAGEVGLDVDETQAVRMAALAYGLNGDLVDDAELAEIVTRARDDLAHDAAPSNGDPV